MNTANDHFMLPRIFQKRGALDSRDTVPLMMPTKLLCATATPEKAWILMNTKDLPGSELRGTTVRGWQGYYIQDYAKVDSGECRSHGHYQLSLSSHHHQRNSLHSCGELLHI